MNQQLQPTPGKIYKLIMQGFAEYGRKPDALLVSYETAKHIALLVSLEFVTISTHYPELPKIHGVALIYTHWQVPDGEVWLVYKPEQHPEGVSPLDPP